MVMIRYGMEQVVDQITTAVTWTILHGFTSLELPSTTIIDNIEMCLCRKGFPDEDIPSVNEIPNFANAAKE